MKCKDFRRSLETEPLPAAAEAHSKSCDACRSLQADLDAIHSAARDLEFEETTPPDRVWVSLRNHLELEGIIHGAPSPESMLPVAAAAPSSEWWSRFQKPAFAGGFLALVLTAAILGGSQSVFAPNGNSVAKNEVSGRPLVEATSAVRSVKDDLLADVNETVSGLAQEDPALTNSLRRNLDIVDNAIAVCEKSVHEEPENEAARDYLNGAYEQKAELLATAMNHGTMGGLR